MFSCQKEINKQKESGAHLFFSGKDRYVKTLPQKKASLEKMQADLAEIFITFHHNIDYNSGKSCGRFFVYKLRDKVKQKQFHKFIIGFWRKTAYFPEKVYAIVTRVDAKSIGLNAY